MFRSPPIKVTVHFDYDDQVTSKDDSDSVGRCSKTSRSLPTSTDDLTEVRYDEFEEYRKRANSGGILPYLPYIPQKDCTATLVPAVDPSKAQKEEEKPKSTMTLNVPLLGPPPAGPAGVDKGRSHSMANPTSEQRQMVTLKLDETDWEMGNMRRRVCSMPSYYRPRDHPNPDDLRRVRSFSITRKGVVCEGDLYVSAACPISDIIGSHHSSRASSCGLLSTGSCTSPATSSESSDIIYHYNVVLIGAAHVGKSTLIQQFIASEHTGVINASFGESTNLYIKYSRPPLPVACNIYSASISLSGRLTDRLVSCIYANRDNRDCFMAF